MNWDALAAGDAYSSDPYDLEGYKEYLTAHPAPADGSGPSSPSLCRPSAKAGQLPQRSSSSSNGPHKKCTPAAVRSVPMRDAGYNTDHSLVAENLCYQDFFYGTDGVGCTSAVGSSSSGGGTRSQSCLDTGNKAIKPNKVTSSEAAGPAPKASTESPNFPDYFYYYEEFLRGANSFSNSTPSLKGPSNESGRSLPRPNTTQGRPKQQQQQQHALTSATPPKADKVADTVPTNRKSCEASQGSGFMLYDLYADFVALHGSPAPASSVPVGHKRQSPSPRGQLGPSPSVNSASNTAGWDDGSLMKAGCSGPSGGETGSASGVGADHVANSKFMSPTTDPLLFLEATAAQGASKAKEPSRAANEEQLLRSLKMEAAMQEASAMYMSIAPDAPPTKEAAAEEDGFFGDMYPTLVECGEAMHAARVEQRRRRILNKLNAARHARGRSASKTPSHEERGSEADLTDTNLFVGLARSNVSWNGSEEEEMRNVEKRKSDNFMAALSKCSEDVAVFGLKAELDDAPLRDISFEYLSPMGSSATSSVDQAGDDACLLAGLYPFDGDFVPAPPPLPQWTQPGAEKDPAPGAAARATEKKAPPRPTSAPQKKKRQLRKSRSLSVDEVTVPGNDDDDDDENEKTISSTMPSAQHHTGINKGMQRAASLSILLTGPEGKERADTFARKETADQGPSPLADPKWHLDERVAKSPQADVLTSPALAKLVADVATGHNAVVFSAHSCCMPRPSSLAEWGTEYILPALLHALFQAFKGKTERHFGISVSVSLLKHDLAYDLLRPSGQSSHVVVTGFPLLGTTLSTSSVRSVASAAEGTALVMGAISSISADDLAKGCVLTNIFVKQKIFDATTGEQRDALLSSMFCLDANTQVCREALLLGVLPATTALLQNALREPCQLCFCLHSQHMSYVETRLALEVQDAMRLVTTPRSRGGSLRRFLKHIKSRYRRLYTLMETAKERVSESRFAWRGYTMPRMEQPLTSKMIEKEADFQHKMHAVYAKDKIWYKRLSFALHAMAAIAKCSEQVLITPVSEMPRSFLVTYRYLDPDWFRVPQDTQKLHANFAGQRDNGMNELSDESIINGKKRRKYTFSYRKSVPILNVLDNWKSQMPRVNLFAGDYGCPSQGILPLFRSEDKTVQRLFPPSKATDPKQEERDDRILSVVMVEDADQEVGAKDAKPVVTVAAHGVNVLIQQKAKEAKALVPFQVDEAIAQPSWSCRKTSGGHTVPSTRFTPSPVVKAALEAFRSGRNVRLMSMTAASQQASSTMRLLRSPVWQALSEMVDHTFSARNKKKQTRLYVSVVQILSSQFVRDHLQAEQKAKASRSTPSPPPTPPPQGDHTTATSEDDVALPFRTAWTPAGPVVQGARYKEVQGGAQLWKLVRSLPKRVNASGTTQTHLIVSFLLHQTTKGGKAKPKKEGTVNVHEKKRHHSKMDSDAVDDDEGEEEDDDDGEDVTAFAQLSVHMTTDLSLFNSLYMREFVQPFHPQNLFHASYCHQLVLVVDVIADYAEEASRVLKRQAELCQSVKVPLFHQVWSMQRYTAYLHEHALAMRAELAKHKTPAEGPVPPVPSYLFPPPSHTAAGNTGVLTGAKVDFQCLSSAWRQVERMLSVATELTGKQPPSPPEESACSPKALSFDGSCTYEVTNPPHLFDRHVTEVVESGSLETSFSSFSSESESESNGSYYHDFAAADSSPSPNDAVKTATVDVPKERQPQPVSRTAAATVAPSPPLLPAPVTPSPAKPKPETTSPPPQPVKSKQEEVLPAPTSPSKLAAQRASAVPAAAPAPVPVPAQAPSPSRPKTAKQPPIRPLPSSPLRSKPPIKPLSPVAPQGRRTCGEKQASPPTASSTASKVASPSTVTTTGITSSVPSCERTPQPPPRKPPTMVQRLKMLDEGGETLPPTGSPPQDQRNAQKSWSRDRESARTPTAAQSRRGDGSILPAVQPFPSTGHIQRETDVDKGGNLYARMR